MAARTRRRRIALAMATGVRISGIPALAAPGVAFLFVPKVAGGTPPYTFARTGAALPTGLSFSASTGAISGTTSVLGTFTGTITVTDAVGDTAALGYSLKVEAGAAPDTTVEAVAANGYEVTWRGEIPAGPVLTGYQDVWQRQGHDKSGAAVVHSLPIRYPHRRRDIAVGSYSKPIYTGNVAVPECHILATDSCAGVANNSSEAAPKPIVTWENQDSEMWFPGETKTFRVYVAHYYAREGQQVPAVRFTLSDQNGDDVDVVASAPMWRPCPTAAPFGPAIGAEVYETTITWDQIAGLANSGQVDGAHLTMRVRAYPWIGGAASVFDSADQPFYTANRTSSLRLYKASAAPRYAYISAGASGGTISADPVAAAAAPFATIGTAMTAAAADGGFVDTVIFRLRSTMAGLSLDWPVAGTRISRGFEMRIEPAPEDYPGNARIPLPWASSRTRLELVAGLTDMTQVARRWDRIDFTRASGNTGTDSLISDHWLYDCSVTDSVPATGIPNSPAGFFMVNSTYAKSAGGSMGGSGTPRVGFYGCRISAPPGFNINNLPGTVLAGCWVDRASSVQLLGVTGGVCWQDTVFYDPQGAYGFGGISSNINQNGVLFGIVTALADNVFGLSGGESAGQPSIYHLCQQHMGWFGDGLCGRNNQAYDNTAVVGAARNHKFITRTNSVSRVRSARKGDITIAANPNPAVAAEAPTRKGMIADAHGVGTQGFVLAAWQEFPHTYLGIGGVSVPYVGQEEAGDLQITNYHGPVWDGSAYQNGARAAEPSVAAFQPVAGSPILTAAPVLTRRFTLTGTVRSLATGRGPLEMAA